MGPPYARRLRVQDHRQSRARSRRSSSPRRRSRRRPRRWGGSRPHLTRSLLRDGVDRSAGRAANPRAHNNDQS